MVLNAWEWYKGGVTNSISDDSFLQPFTVFTAPPKIDKAVNPTPFDLPVEPEVKKISVKKSFSGKVYDSSQSEAVSFSISS